MATKSHDPYIPLQINTSATLWRDMMYNYNNMKEIIPRV